jgi:hypothetical protein
MARRRFQRVRVDLLGRYMLPDRRGQVVNMSPGGMALIAPVSGQPGERVIAYVDHLGRLEGHVARIFPNGFAMTIAATPRKRDKLAAQLTWLANRHILGLPEDRRHGRVLPRNPITRLILPNGINVSCRIIDVSQSGAGIASDRGPRSARWSRSARRRPCRAASGKRLRDRVHPAAASGLSRRRGWPGLERNRAPTSWPHAAKKFATIGLRISSLSTCGTCPQSLMISTFEFAIRAANSLA